MECPDFIALLHARRRLGSVLRVDQIKAWFSTFKAKRTKSKAVEDPREAFWRCHTVAKLEQELGESGKTKEALVQLALAREAKGATKKGFWDGAYHC